MSHIPAGTSTANVLHWAQMVNSHKIQMYDYGSVKKNMMHYNMSTPPLYNLSLINVPVYLYSGENDWIADKRDIQAINFDLLLLHQKFTLSIISFN
ncbi:unnamed protein product [Onchocerca flexuosa]|uniref:Peptidase_S9 domain-containing protein n=1 Tax=Onchocerca flexuosa TaxID=387005 RepID=A0A183H1E2_9BILA|nr:unnamed protein product [Onchocerca flexuosa]